MSDHDDDLRAIFRSAAERAKPAAGAETKLLKEARRRRGVTAAAGALVVVLMVGGLAGAATLLGGRDGIKPAPGVAEPERAFARYFFEVTEVDDSARGVIEVDWARRSICLEADAPPGIVASHLIARRSELPQGEHHVAPVALTFFELGDRFGSFPSEAICLRDLNQVLLREIIDDHESFAVDFHRDPDDQPGLVAKLVLQGEVLDDDVDSAGVLEDTIEVQGGTIRFQVIPESLGNGKVAEILLVNDSDALIGYGHEYVLEKQSSSGWEPVKSPTNCVFTQELIFIAPGDQIGHPIGPYNRACAVVPIGPGEYRVSKTVELESGDRVPLTVSFSVASRDSEIAPIRPFVRVFMAARITGAGAEDFLGADGWPDSGPTGEPAPLYPDGLQDFRIEFVDDLGDGTYEVGVSLVFESRTNGETLFLREGRNSFVIAGARPGLEGP